MERSASLLHARLLKYICRFLFFFVFLTDTFAALWQKQTLHGGEGLLNSITDSWTTHFPTVSPRKQRHHRRTNLLSTRRNLAALRKEDQGSQRNVSRLGIWRSTVAIALPSCCFAESRPPLLSFARSTLKTKERDMLTSSSSTLALSSAFSGRLRDCALDIEFIEKFTCTASTT